MINVRNEDNKKVCRVDPQSRTVEIIQRGCQTTITFLADGTLDIRNTKST